MSGNKNKMVLNKGRKPGMEPASTDFHRERHDSRMGNPDMERRIAQIAEMRSAAKSVPGQDGTFTPLRLANFSTSGTSQRGATMGPEAEAKLREFVEEVMRMEKDAGESGKKGDASSYFSGMAKAAAVLGALGLTSASCGGVEALKSKDNNDDIATDSAWTDMADSDMGTDSDVDTDIDTDTDSDSDADSGMGNDLDADMDSDTDGDAGMGTDSATETGTETGTDSESETSTGGDTETSQGTDTSNGTDSATETSSDTDSESETGTGTGGDTDTSSDTGNDTDSSTETASTDADVDSDSDVDGGMDGGSDTDTSSGTSTGTETEQQDYCDPSMGGPAEDVTNPAGSQVAVSYPLRDVRTYNTGMFNGDEYVQQNEFSAGLLAGSVVNIGGRNWVLTMVDGINEHVKGYREIPGWPVSGDRTMGQGDSVEIASGYVLDCRGVDSVGRTWFSLNGGEPFFVNPATPAAVEIGLPAGKRYVWVASSDIGTNSAMVSIADSYNSFSSTGTHTSTFNGEGALVGLAIYGEGCIQ